MPTTYLLIAIILCVGLHLLLPIQSILPPPWNLFGLIPIIFGIWINLSADRAFKKADTTVKPFEETSSLITEGVFQWTRNPMYLGFVAILLGISICLRSLSPYAVVVLFVVLLDQLFIRIEEQMLEKEHGKAWKQYRSKVRKWI
jgi:protein-S-isoprenylcysteine O-methyltransferase Ste14